MISDIDNKIIVGEIKKVEKHPNSDKLLLATVSDGSNDYQVVCGAHNIKEGQHVPFAQLGSNLPGDIKIEKRNIRGLDSEGMLCSQRDLGIGTDHEGIFILSENNGGVFESGKPILNYKDKISQMLNEKSTAENEQFELIKSVGEEITTEEELLALIRSGKQMIAYDGFEPSGKIHLPQGLIRANNINKMIKAGCKFKVLVADWHAWANHKLGGDLEKIQNTGKYFIEVWKASGLDIDKVEFVWASDLVKKEGYWDMVMKIAVKKNLPRIIRTVEIMGRNEKDSLTVSQIIYPLMQATDIFMLDANITQLGMDQRKVNMLAREIAEDLGREKPIVVSHHMLLGLQMHESVPGETSIDRSIRLKMSKSKPDSAIFMTDTKEDLKRKIEKAWCPECTVDENPILEYVKYTVFEISKEMEIKRPEKYGGNIKYTSYEELAKDYKEKRLFPLDLKNALIEYLDMYLQPVRDYFEKNPEAKRLKELVESYQVTR